MSNTPTTETDRDLINRFNRGDLQAFDLLVQKHANRAYQIAYGVLGSKEDAQEVAQDVFVRVYRALPKFRGDAEFTTWMYRIAMNLARNRYRWNKSRGAKVNISLDEPLADADGSTELSAQVPDTTDQPDRNAEWIEMNDRIAEEVEKLPELYREALVLRNVQDMSYEKIAEVLGCKIGTIKSRIARARETLRQSLQL